MKPICAPLLILSMLISGCQPSSESKTGGQTAYPRRTVTIICPWGVGGGTDSISRYFADALRKDLGKPFVVVNKTGGSGVLGHSSGARARPDGYTITMITAELNTMHQMGLTDLV